MEIMSGVENTTLITIVSEWAVEKAAEVSSQVYVSVICMYAFFNITLTTPGSQLREKSKRYK